MERNIQEVILMLYSLISIRLVLKLVQYIHRNIVDEVNISKLYAKLSIFIEE